MERPAVRIVQSAIQLDFAIVKHSFAFPAAIVFLMTIGLLDLAITLSPEDWSLHHVWLMMPLFYYAGLWRAKRRYQ